MAALLVLDRRPPIRYATVAQIIVYAAPHVAYLQERPIQPLPRGRGPRHALERKWSIPPCP